MLKLHPHVEGEPHCSSTGAKMEMTEPDLTVGDPSYDGIVRYMRETPPAHFTFQIESFSLMSKMHEEKHDSNEFESGGYKWKLSIYPNGDKNNDGDGHISLYLSLSDTSAFAPGWEVIVNCKLFAHDQIRDKFMSVHDNYGGIRRFHRVKNKWGFAQFISLGTFNQASNGFLVNDSCIFGAEVFVVKSSCKWERRFMFKEHVTTWNTNNFSSLTDKEPHYSKEFRVGNYNWKMRIDVKGCGNAKDTHLSLFLKFMDTENLPPNRKVYVKFKLRIRNQFNNLHWEGTFENWFSASSSPAYGYFKFIALSDLHNVSKGYLTNDTLIAEVEIISISEVSDSP